MTRIHQYSTFWPYYLDEHRDPRSRWLHFVGTTGFFVCVIMSAVKSPILFPPALFVMLVLGVLAAAGEGSRPRWPLVALMVLIPTLAAPTTFLPGVISAYGCAWVGHFVLEKNRPATFKYPIWSLGSDFRMWSHMIRGRLWTGTSPARAVGV